VHPGRNLLDEATNQACQIVLSPCDVDCMHGLTVATHSLQQRIREQALLVPAGLIADP